MDYQSPHIMSEQAHLHSMFENATEGIILTDKKGTILMANPSSCQIFAYAEDELVGQPVEILLPDNKRHFHQHLRDDFYDQPANRAMGQGRDLYARKKNGENFPVELSLSHYSQEGELFVIVFIVDITRRKAIELNMLKQRQELEQITIKIKKLNEDLEAKVEERTKILREALLKLEQSQNELKEALDKEKQLNTIKSRFISMASHEFRTPLTTILSSATLLSKYQKEDDTPKREKHITRIKNSVSNLDAILNDFLSVDNLEQGKVAVQYETIDLPHFIQDVLDEMKPFLKANQEIVLYIDDVVSLDADIRLLKNILFNLLGNAIKFSTENKNVAFRVNHDADTLTMAIKDQGIGIPEEDVEHLFTSFFRAANATNIQGTGLGLHIVKRYVNLMGGDIKIESELNKGTTVTVFLPLKK